MSEIIPHFKKVSSFIEDIRYQIRDTGHSRWTDSEIRRGINYALAQWHGRVEIPHIYTIPGGWQTGVYEYSLPNYIPANKIRPQKRVLTPYVGTSGTTQQWIWTDVQGWTVEPTADGSQLLRTMFSEGVVGNSDNDARILYWTDPSPIPVEGDQVLAANISASDTTISGTPSHGDIGRNGYVAIEDEFIAYSGVTSTSSGFSLLNCTRGVVSTAASHSAGDSIEWLLAAPFQGLFEQLQNGTISYLHSLFLSSGTTQEIEMHQWQMRWYKQLADDFWMTWTPVRTVGLKQSDRTMTRGDELLK